MKSERTLSGIESHSFLTFCSVVVACSSFILLFSCQIALTAQVTLEWDSNTEPGLAGYKIYYGTSSGSYDAVVDVGNWTSCTIASLEEGKTYFFAATAYDLTGNESNFSEEVYTTLPYYPLTCDLDYNGKCDTGDFLLFELDWERNDCADVGVDCKCDLTQDGNCDLSDWLLFIENWEQTNLPAPR